MLGRSAAIAPSFPDDPLYIPRRIPPPRTNSAGPVFGVGERVSARKIWCEDERFYAGQIAKVERRRNRYTVEFDDGETEHKLPGYHIRKVMTALKAETQQQHSQEGEADEHGVQEALTHLTAPPEGESSIASPSRTDSATREHASSGDELCDEVHSDDIGQADEGMKGGWTTKSTSNGSPASSPDPGAGTTAQSTASEQSDASDQELLRPPPAFKVDDQVDVRQPGCCGSKQYTGRVQWVQEDGSYTIRKANGMVAQGVPEETMSLTPTLSESVAPAAPQSTGEEPLSDAASQSVAAAASVNATRDNRQQQQQDPEPASNPEPKTDATQRDRMPPDAEPDNTS